MHIVIVGGGFGGVKTALELSKDTSLSVTLISDKDYFVYYPALYSTATGGSYLESIVSLKKIFEGTRVKVIEDTITQYDPARHIVAGKKSYHYDKVVFALGVVTSYFGISGLAAFSYSIKNYTDVMKFKAHLHDELVADRHMDKHYIIAGAGPTGVELSAALAHYLDRIAAAHRIKHSRISIKLVEASHRVLPKMSERASAVVTARLKKLGVQVMTNKKVEAQDNDGIMISGTDVATKTVVWTSGVSNHPFFTTHSSHFALASNGKVEVNPHLMTNASTYVIGDNANTLYTGLAQTALHDALYIAADIKNSFHKRARNLYRDIKPPIVVPVGKGWAVFEWHGIVITGKIASAIRRASDFIGYDDVLPVGQALGVWRATRTNDEECTICKKA
ncbi:FAD-dependent oxidoreductase [Pedobacter sp.]|nr:FAD-dependent oxidoreductase [Candidatus Saccharibacteria bacterium]